MNYFLYICDRHVRLDYPSIPGFSLKIVIGIKFADTDGNGQIGAVSGIRIQVFSVVCSDIGEISLGQNPIR